MKRIFVVILILTLVQAACNLPQAATVQATPNLSAAMETIAPASTSTVESVSVSTPLVETSTLEATQIPAVPLTETPTSTATLTETPTQAKLFSDVTFSAQIISPNCGPQSVHIEAFPADPKTYSVVLFIRLHYKTAGDKTNWNEGFAMKPSIGKFVYDLRASSIADFNKFKDPVAWVQLQFVVIDSVGNIIGRSEVFTDKLTITSICS
jgi:hypothetical protein